LALGEEGRDAGEARLADLEVRHGLEHGLCGDLVVDQDLTGVSCEGVVGGAGDVLIVDVLAIEDCPGDERDAEVVRLLAVVGKAALAFEEDPQPAGRCRDPGSVRWGACYVSRVDTRLSVYIDVRLSTNVAAEAGRDLFWDEVVYGHG